MSRQGSTRKATGEKGVYQIVSENKTTRTSRGKTIPDVCYYIAFKLDGKLTWEKVGWLSDGYSVKVAADIRAERTRSMRHGEELPQQKKKAITFQGLAKEYLKWSAENKSRNGIDDKSRYENHLKDRFGDKRLDEISPFDLERMKADMSKAGISPKTISHCLGLLRAMYNKAADWSLYDGPNPVKKIKMPVVQNARDRFLSVEEADKLLKELKRNNRYKNKTRNLDDPKLHDIALFSLHTGARAAEIFNLRLQDVDAENGLVALKDTKNNETRYAPMTGAVRDMLKRRMPKDDESRNPNDLIFTDDNGEQIKEVSKSFERVVDRLGFNEGVTDARQKIVFHSLRHSFASWLAIQGTPIFTIAKLMGHKSISMSERYAHLTPDHKRDAVKGLETALKRKVIKIKKEKVRT